MNRYLLIACVCICLMAGLPVIAQRGCPPNIGFEKGNFDGWDCEIGTLNRQDGAFTMARSAPMWGKHTVLKNNGTPDPDIYGGFPMICPNGSGYSVMLGNDQTGAQVDRISYRFMVPENQQDYSIIYNYAVVFQNPAHADWEQPKFTARVYDESTNTYLECSSFSYTANESLPGFHESRVKDSVFYKEWTPVTIKLNGLAGKFLRLEFTTFDCTRGGHFGYAYIDVNQNCRSAITGNVFCQVNDKVFLTGPFGYKDYRWYNDNFTTQYAGDENTLLIDPLPPANTRIALEITPYAGQGCTDTLYTTITESPVPLVLKVKKNHLACSSTGVDISSPAITAGSTKDLTFYYYSDEALKHPLSFATIKNSGTYYIQAEDTAGCTTSDSLHVQIEPLPVFSVTNPPSVFRPETVSLFKTISLPDSRTYAFSYWYDEPATREIITPGVIKSSGTYYIRAASTLLNDCAVIQPVTVVIKDPPILPPNIFTPNKDGIHDDWRIPELAYYPECIVQVYTRTGMLLFTSLPGYTKPWDGTYNGQPVPIATYYYVIVLNKELAPLGGSVTVVR